MRFLGKKNWTIRADEIRCVSARGINLLLHYFALYIVALIYAHTIPKKLDTSNQISIYNQQQHPLSSECR